MTVYTGGYSLKDVNKYAYTHMHLQIFIHLENGNKLVYILQKFKVNSIPFHQS